MQCMSNTSTTTTTNKQGATTMKNKTYIISNDNPYDNQDFVICDDCLERISPIKNVVSRSKADKECECDYCGKV